MRGAGTDVVEKFLGDIDGVNFAGCADGLGEGSVNNPVPAPMSATTMPGLSPTASKIFAR
ncbi:MAG: hypothetical protein R3F31_08390 [Verrucomicrobiales bacterium]